MAETVSGKCLCGSVAFDAVIKSREAGVCHCTMCQKWAGGASFLVECESLDVAESDAVGVYRASEWGERGFCKNCGSSVFWRMQDGSHANVAMAAIEGIDDFTFKSEIYIDEKPNCYSFAQDTTKMTGAEFIEMFTKGQAD